MPKLSKLVLAGLVLDEELLLPALYLGVDDFGVEEREPELYFGVLDFDPLEYDDRPPDEEERPLEYDDRPLDEEERPLEYDRPPEDDLPPPPPPLPSA